MVPDVAPEDMVECPACGDTFATFDEMYAHDCNG